MAAPCLAFTVCAVDTIGYFLGVKGGLIQEGGFLVTKDLSNGFWEINSSLLCQRIGQKESGSIRMFMPCPLPPVTPCAAMMTGNSATAPVISNAAEILLQHVCQSIIVYFSDSIAVSNNLVK
jgi:hypothetical protein